MRLTRQQRAYLYGIVKRAKEVDLDGGYTKGSEMGEGWLQEFEPEVPTCAWDVTLGAADAVIAFVNLKGFIEIGEGNPGRPYIRHHRGTNIDEAIEKFESLVEKWIDETRIPVTVTVIIQVSVDRAIFQSEDVVDGVNLLERHGGDMNAAAVEHVKEDIERLLDHQLDNSWDNDYFLGYEDYRVVDAHQGLMPRPK